MCSYFLLSDKYIHFLFSFFHSENSTERIYAKVSIVDTLHYFSLFVLFGEKSADLAKQRGEAIMYS